MGTGSIIRPGDVQRMSAGTGVTHSEFNASRDASRCTSCRSGSCPSAAASRPATSRRRSRRPSARGKLRLVASPDGRDGSVTIHQDVDAVRGAAARGRGAAARAGAGAPRVGAGGARAGRARRRAAGGGRRGRDQRRARPGADRRRFVGSCCSSTSRDARVTRLHLVDGTYELYRAHFAPRPEHRAPGGGDARRRSASSRRCWRCSTTPDEAVTHIAVAFDNPIRSFRNDLFAGVQERRGRAARAARAVRHRRGGGARARRRRLVDARVGGRRRAGDRRAPFADEVDQVRIMTPDKDLGQCLRGERVVQVDRRQRKVTDEAALPRAPRLRAARACPTSWR